MATATVQYFFSNGSMDASLASAAKARIILAVQCADADSLSENWRVSLYQSSSQQNGEWVLAAYDGVQMNHTDSSYPTLVLSDVDLLYPFNELVVYWSGETQPEFTVRAWVIYS
jgi:hypothetical protein